MNEQPRDEQRADDLSAAVRPIASDGEQERLDEGGFARDGEHVAGRPEPVQDDELRAGDATHEGLEGIDVDRYRDAGGAEADDPDGDAG